MSKLLSLGGVACSVFVALAGCQELPSDADPDPLDSEDAGQTVDPIVVPDTRDPVKDAGPVVVDAGLPKVDAAADTSVPDAGSDAEVDAYVADSGPVIEEDAGPVPTAFESMYAVVTASCTGCHGAGKTLDLSTPELAHAGLVGVAAQYSACVGDGSSEPPMRVVAGSPDDSLLIAKLQNTQSCGKQMPPKALLSADQVEVFRAWIAAGAPAQ